MVLVRNADGSRTHEITEREAEMLRVLQAFIPLAPPETTILVSGKRLPIGRTYFGELEKPVNTELGLTNDPS